MSTENGNMGPADIAAVVDGGRGNGFGWGDGSFIWILILFLFAGGWGGGFGGGYGNGGTIPYMNVQNGFDQAAIMGGLSGINASLNAGFANQEVASCNRAMDAMQTAYTNQIASMNQNFANQTALSAQLNGLSAGIEQSCAINRESLADLKYTVATENCADRTVVSDGIRDLIAATQAQTQTILNQLANDKLDAKNERIQELTSQINMMNLAASQNAQTAAILANNEAQTAALEAYLQPPVRPCYLVPNPNCCSSYTGCGCGVVA